MAINDTELAISDPINGNVYLYLLINDEVQKTPVTLTWSPINDFFGSDIIMDNSTLLISAPLSERQQGKVIVYEKVAESWIHTHTLSGNPACMHYGYQMAMGNNYIAILSQAYREQTIQAWEFFLKEAVIETFQETNIDSAYMGSTV